MACARGCSDDFSTLAASRSNSASPSTPLTITSVNSGLPLVIVPVLSNTMASSLCAVSRASAERIRMPFSAPLPVPTIMDVGVARPSAQGQAMINTVIDVTSAKSSWGDGPKTNQMAKLQMATRITIGTK